MPRGPERLNEGPFYVDLQRKCSLRNLGASLNSSSGGDSRPRKEEEVGMDDIAQENTAELYPERPHLSRSLATLKLNSYFIEGEKFT